jgi:hypothetical protein
MLSLIAVIVLFLIAWAGTAIGLQVVFGIIIPYLALLTFFVGFVCKIIGGALSHPHHRWSAKIASLDQAFPVGQPCHQLAGGCAYGTGNIHFSVSVSQYADAVERGFPNLLPA